MRLLEAVPTKRSNQCCQVGEEEFIVHSLTHYGVTFLWDAAFEDYETKSFCILEQVPY